MGTTHEQDSANSTAAVEPGTIKDMRIRHPLVHTSLAGATAGVLAMGLVIRLNPELKPTLRTLILGIPLWASWGAVMVGLPATAVLALVGRFRHGIIPGGRWPSPIYMAVAFTVAAILSRVNADFHPDYLSGSGHRILRHDAVAWLIAGLMAILGGMIVRRLGRPPWMRRVFVTTMMALPIIRLIIIPSPVVKPKEIPPQPLGAPTQRLLVCGIEGLDSQIMLTHVSDGQYPTLDRLQSGGASGHLNPFRPFLPRAHWTSLGTGTLPRRNGVKSRWGWHFPLLFDETLRLLPWTPQGSRLILPWGLAERVTPPPSTVPPLWQRMQASGVSTKVLDWPGLWDADATVIEVAPVLLDRFQHGSLIASIEQALEAFPRQQQHIIEVIATDLERINIAMAALRHGQQNVWLQLNTLGAVRRDLEPLQPMDTDEREVLNLVVELLDRKFGDLLEAAGPETLVAIVSPTGLSPPDSYERLRRFFGSGGNWRTSAENCPDGFLVLNGEGVAFGRSFTGADLEDLAPTLCYLLGLPVAQYMDGRVILEIIDEEFLQEHPLRVID